SRIIVNEKKAENKFCLLFYNFQLTRRIEMGTLWYGGNIYTMQRPEHKVEAVYTDGEKIIAVGSKFDLETSFRHKIERKVNLEGATMFPGFVDSHMHLIGHGE